MSASRKSLRQTAYDYMKKQIVYCHWMPGQTIVESDICKKLGMSKTPVHEALKDLGNDRYVIIAPRKSTKVSKTSLKDINEIIEARVLNETYIIKTIAFPLEPAQREELLAIRREGADLGPTDNRTDTRRFVSLDYKFHCAIARLSQNTHISNFCQRLFEESMRIWYLMYVGTQTRTVEAFREHNQIIDCLLGGDAATAERILLRHIQAFYDSFYVME